MRSRRDRFAFGALEAGFAAIFAINAMNPDVLIATTNTDRLQQDIRFDPYYLTTLSADAVPTMVESLPEIGRESVWQGYSLEQEILYKWNIKHKNWLTYNLGRYRVY